MKKYIVLIGLSISIILNIYMFSDRDEDSKQFNAQELVLTTQIYTRDEQINELNNEYENRVIEIEELNSNISAYEVVLKTMLKNKSTTTFDLINQVYEYNIGYIEDYITYDLPRNGKIYTTADSIKFFAAVHKPPHLSDEDLDYVFHNNNITPLYRQIQGSIAQDAILNEADVSYTFDLTLGETIRVRPSPLFIRSFDLDFEVIEITKLDENLYKKGSDYFPSESMVKRFKNNLGQETHAYELINENLLSLEVDNSGVVNYFSIGDHVLLTHMIYQSEERSINDLRLPGQIIEGESWRLDDYYYEISALNENITVPAGTFNCIVVDVYISNIFTGRLYYGEKVGIVKIVLGNDELIELENIDYSKN
jgi:hypothetical protein